MTNYGNSRTGPIFAHGSPREVQCLGCGYEGPAKEMHHVGDRYQHHYLCESCWEAAA